MSNFTDCILVKLVPSEPDYIALSTFDIAHGRTNRFLLCWQDMVDLLADEHYTLLDTDLGNYVQINRNRNNIHFKVTWLHQNFRNDVSGHIHSFTLPVEKLKLALAGRKVHHIEYLAAEHPKAQLTITDSSHDLLRKFCQDKLTKHALRRFFRDNFNYGRDERLVIYPDNWIRGFFFQSSNDRFSGGIVRHEDVVIGKDGREYKKVFYALHT